jgi:hypothetical protein
MKVYGGVHVYIHILLASAVVGGEWSASCPGRFTPEQKTPRYPLARVGPRAGLDGVKKRKFLTLAGLELQPSVFQPVPSRYTDWAVFSAR